MKMAAAMSTPNTKKPPGGEEKMAMVSSPSGSTWMPKKVPMPRISRMEPMITRVRVKPRPMPSPSRAESTTVFLEANSSARPRMMQLTTIRGR